jgi:RNA polymerase sigma-70 factor (ECF subfamily)
MHASLPNLHGEAVALVQRLFIQHVTGIKGFILGLSPDFAAVDDVLQEVFLTVTNRADAYDPELSFLPWVRGIARNKVLERRRKLRNSLPTLSPEALDALCAAAPDEGAASLSADKSEALQHCMDRLSPNARRAIDLRYRDTRNVPEIAAQLGWTVGSVSVALSRALGALHDCVRRKLARDGGG